jgi:hypothetical protein
LARAELTGDHLAGVQSDPQLQLDTIASPHLGGESRRFLLDGQRRQAGANSVVLQCRWSAKQSHDAVASEIVDGAAVAVHHVHCAVNECGHDLAKPLCPDCGGDIHRVDHVGEQHRRLLVLSRFGGGRNGGAALAAELRVLAQYSAARHARHSGRRHASTADPGPSPDAPRIRPLPAEKGRY